jgi:hypothetical protein
MCLSKTQLCAGLILLHVTVSVVANGMSADEEADPIRVLFRGSRHRLSAHRKKQEQNQNQAEELSTNYFQGDEMGGHRALWDERLLAQKQKKKKKKNDKHKADKNNKKYSSPEDVKKVNKEEKKKVEKMKKGAVVAKVEEEGMQVMEEVTARGKNDWDSGNDCICVDQVDDWTGDTWEGDSWSANSWTGDHGLPIGWKEDGWDVDEHYKDDLKHLRADIVQLIENTHRDLLPKCLRLAFHDCIDGCDGCIDMDELDNGGLNEPVELLFPLVRRYQHKLSRADVWAYCAVVAADMAMVDNRPHDLYFSMHYVGRKDCKGADEKGFGGPKVILYEPHLTTHEMIAFFYERFGFDPYETVVLMGVHSAAVAHREILGFGNLGREDGWIHEADKYKLSNLYYSSMLNNVWELQKVENEGIVPDRYQWYFGDEDEGPIMLTTDTSLILDMKGFITTDSKGVGGKVMCRAHPEAEFEVEGEGDPKDVPLCPMAKQTRDIVEELSKDNTQFLFAFVIVLNKMLTNGYSRRNLPVSKASKVTSKGKGGKGRNLISSNERDEHSTYGRDDSAEMEESAMTHQLLETSARKKEVNSSKLTQKYWHQNTGESKSLNSGKPSNKKWCSCHKNKPVKTYANPTIPTYTPTLEPK